MQPTFLPWLGYFALIRQVDRFVFLDNVQFNKRSWQQRNRIKTTNGPAWLTVPVASKGLHKQHIRDVEIQYDGPSLEKICKSIESAYSKASYFDDYFPAIGSIFASKPERLQGLNESLILHLCEVMGIQLNICHASELDISGSKANLLANICSDQGADYYVSPPGSKEYIDKSTVFDDAGINVIYHQYSHPVYRQLYSEFIPYMCILDLLFNEGPRSSEIIRSGIDA
jgi:hypothetical protein